MPKIFRSTPITTFKNGQQVFLYINFSFLKNIFCIIIIVIFLKIYENLPIDLAVKKRIPDDRTVLVIPQDNSIRYREMQLRTRRNLNDAKNNICRELSAEDVSSV